MYTSLKHIQFVGVLIWELPGIAIKIFFFIWFKYLQIIR